MGEVYSPYAILVDWPIVVVDLLFVYLCLGKEQNLKLGPQVPFNGWLGSIGKEGGMNEGGKALDKLCKFSPFLFTAGVE